MDYRLLFTRSAERDLDRLDRSEALKILKKVDEFLALVDPMVKAKRLKGFTIPTYRFRVGDYRVVFRLDEQTGKLVVLVVLRIAHRKEMYRGR